METHHVIGGAARAARARCAGVPARAGRFAGVLEHDPVKRIPVFGKDHAPTEKLEHEKDSKQSHPALALGAPATPWPALTLGGRPIR